MMIEIPCQIATKQPSAVLSAVHDRDKQPETSSSSSNQAASNHTRTRRQLRGNTGSFFAGCAGIHESNTLLPSPGGTPHACVCLAPGHGSAPHPHRGSWWWLFVWTCVRVGSFVVVAVCVDMCEGGVGTSGCVSVAGIWQRRQPHPQYC